MLEMHICCLCPILVNHLQNRYANLLTVYNKRSLQRHQDWPAASFMEVSLEGVDGSEPANNEHEVVCTLS